LLSLGVVNIEVMKDEIAIAIEQFDELCFYPGLYFIDACEWSLKFFFTVSISPPCFHCLVSKSPRVFQESPNSWNWFSLHSFLTGTEEGMC